MGPSVVALDSLPAKRVEETGGKAANLGVLLHAGLPVPPGFVITTTAFFHALEQAHLRKELQRRFLALDIHDTRALEECASWMQDEVRALTIPMLVQDAILSAYHQLGDQVFVAIRSSAVGEDREAASFAGMHETYTNVRGESDVLRRVQDCWASAYGQRVLAYRRGQGMDDEPAVAVVVQKMVAAQKSGVLFTVDPATANPAHIVIEAALGLGEVVVGGQVQPDLYRVDKANGKLLEHRKGQQAYQIVRDTAGKESHVQISAFDAGRPVLQDQDLERLVMTAQQVEKVFGAPQDLEWAMENGHLFVVQSRPITTLPGRQPRSISAPNDGPPAVVENPILLQGQGASPGRRRGQVRILTKVDEVCRLKPGEILVAPMTSPDWVAAMQRAAAIVTDAGGITCHAAIVSRELQIPCVVGTKNATKILHDGDWIEVDGRLGRVSRSPSEGLTEARPEQGPFAESVASTSATAWNFSTATPLRLNVGLPDQLGYASNLPAEGVGLLRAEFLYLRALNGKHPGEWLAENQHEVLAQRLAASIRPFAECFSPKPVIYRTYDFRSNEFRGLQGGAKHEPIENNPMLGFRGCFRYIHEPALFDVELEALGRVREEFGNLQIMLPFVRTPWELERCLERIEQSRLGRQRGLERWLMAEVPSVFHNLTRYAALGVHGVSVGSNDLTQLMLATDRDSNVCAELFNEEDDAVLQMVTDIVVRAKELGLQTSICGQAPSHSRRYLEALVRVGIDSISVTPDAFWTTARNLRAEEQKLILAYVRQHHAN